MRSKDLRKRLMIKFRGEDGLDYGGVAREWLYLLSHEMLNPYYGLFQYSRDDIYTLQINPDSGINPDHLSYFHFVGRIIGMAVFHGHHIDGGFTTPFYKMLLNKTISLADIEGVDPDLHSSLSWMLENDVGAAGLLDTVTFSVEHEAFGVVQSHALKEGGKDIPVSYHILYNCTRRGNLSFLSLSRSLRRTSGSTCVFTSTTVGAGGSSSSSWHCRRDSTNWCHSSSSSHLTRGSWSL